MKEIYRSFEGKLDAEKREGYVVYDYGQKYEIHFVSAYSSTSDVNDTRVRIYKEDLPDITDLDKITELMLKINDGSMRGEAFYKHEWYRQQYINKLQEVHQDYNWRKYI